MKRFLTSKAKIRWKGIEKFGCISAAIFALVFICSGIGGIILGGGGDSSAMISGLVMIAIGAFIARIGVLTAVVDHRYGREAIRVAETLAVSREKVVPLSSLGLSDSAEEKLRELIFEGYLQNVLLDAANQSAIITAPTLDIPSGQPPEARYALCPHCGARVQITSERSTCPFCGMSV